MKGGFEENNIKETFFGSGDRCDSPFSKGGGRIFINFDSIEVEGNSDTEKREKED